MLLLYKKLYKKKFINRKLRKIPARQLGGMT